MKILIFGVTGMLGHKLYQTLDERLDVRGTLRGKIGSVSQFGFFDENKLIEGIDVTDPVSVVKVIEETRPEVVINAVGATKHVPAGSKVIDALRINSIFPQQLAAMTGTHGFRLITVSTDCVFRGNKGNYTEDDPPDANDLYGLSKRLGEVEGENVLTIRTSMIGRELGTSHGLVEWFLSHRTRRVKGYTRAIFSGFTTIALSRIIKAVVLEHPKLNGLYHVSAEPISKLELLNILNANFDTGITIEPDPSVAVDRSLDSSRFREATGITVEKWSTMVSEMAADETPYELWHS